MASCPADYARSMREWEKAREREQRTDVVRKENGDTTRVQTLELGDVVHLCVNYDPLGEHEVSPPASSLRMTFGITYKVVLLVMLYRPCRSV